MRSNFPLLSRASGPPLGRKHAVEAFQRMRVLRTRGPGFPRCRHQQSPPCCALRWLSNIWQLSDQVSIPSLVVSYLRRRDGLPSFSNGLLSFTLGRFFELLAAQYSGNSGHSSSKATLVIVLGPVQLIGFASSLDARLQSSGSDKGDLYPRNLPPTPSLNLQIDLTVATPRPREHLTTCMV